MPQRSTPSAVTINSRDVQGDDSWIKLRRPNQMATRRLEQTQRLEEAGVTFDASGKPKGGEFSGRELAEQGLHRLAETLVDWNWVDGDGAPLPKPEPDKPEEMMARLPQILTEWEMDWLLETVATFLESPKNSKRSRRSSRR